MNNTRLEDNIGSKIVDIARGQNSVVLVLDNGACITITNGKAK